MHTIYPYMKIYMKALDMRTLNSLIPNHVHLWAKLITYNIIGKIHSTLELEVCQDGCSSKQMVVLGFGCIKLFYDFS